MTLEITRPRALALFAAAFTIVFAVLGARVASAAAPVRIAEPQAERLVRGGAVKVVVRTAPGATRFRAHLNGRDVTSRFRGGRATLRGLQGGANQLSVRVRAGGRTRYAHRSFVKLTRRRSLIELSNPAQGILRHATDPGVRRVAFRTPPDATVRVTLNGRRVRLPRPGAGHSRTLVLSRLDGLRHGRNALRIVAYLPGGRFDTETQDFEVLDATPLAAAGRDRAAVAGRRVRLDARGSRAGAAGSRMSYRWRQVRGAPARLRGATGARPTVRASRPGSVVLAMTATEHRSDGRTLTSTDLLEVAAAPDMPPKGTLIDTMAPDPKGQASGDGLLLDSRWGSGAGAGGQARWYRHDSVLGGAKAAAYAIDERTLAVTASAPFDGDAALQTFLGNVPAGSIVVLVGRDGCCASSKLVPTSGAFSQIFDYDGKGTANVKGAGMRNAGLKLGDGTAGRLGGRLRIDVADSSYRYVQTDGAGYSTAADDRFIHGPLDGSTVRIRSSSADRMLAGAGLAGRSSADDQQWQLRRAYGGFFLLRNGRTGACLDATPQLVDCDEAARGQLWFPDYRSSDATYVLRSGSDSALGQVLTATGGSVSLTDSNAIDARWTFELAPGVYTIADADTGVVVAEADAIKTPGRPLVAGAPTGAPTEQWRVVDGIDGGMRFVNVATTQCMDVTGASTSPGAVVESWQCVGSAPNQSWSADADSDGISVTSFGSRLVLAHRGGSVIQAADDDGTASRSWVLRRMPEPAPGGTYTLATAEAQPGSDGLNTPRGLESGPGGSVWLGADVGTLPEQQWRIEQLEMAGVVRLRNLATGQCINHDTDHPSSTALVLGQCWTMYDIYDSSWRLRPQGDGTYSLETVEVSGVQARVLGVDGAVEAGLQAPNGSITQKFTFHGRPVTFAVGGQRYPTAVRPGTAGFAVLALDQNLQPVQGTPATFGAGEAAGLAQLLKTAAGTPGTTVLLQSVGRPRPGSADWNALASAIDALGGNGQTFLRLDGTGDYALAGCSGCGRAAVLNEVVQKQVQKGLAGARLNGSLERDGNATFAPATGTAATVDPTLRGLAERPDGGWPFADTAAGLGVLQAIHDHYKTGLGSPSCTGSVDPVRATYCVKNDRANWTSLSDDLKGLTAADLKDSSVDPALFAQVQAQLYREWTTLDAVHELVDAAEKTFDWAGESTGNAQNIASTIYSNMGRALQQRNVGGTVFDVMRNGLSLIEAVGPILAAEPGAEPEPEPGDAADAFMGLLSDIYALASHSDSASTAPTLDGISTTATAYAKQLDEHLDDVRDNLVVVENILVSDPVRLMLASANANERWNVDETADPLQAQLKAGMTQSLWRELVPAAFELWQFPHPPAGFAVNTLECVRIPTHSGSHKVYSGLPDGAVIDTSLSAGAGGALTAGTIQVLTPTGDDDINHNTDRVARQPLLDALHGSGLAQPDWPSAMAFDVRKWPNGMYPSNDQAQCWMENSSDKGWYLP